MSGRLGAEEGSALALGLAGLAAVGVVLLLTVDLTAYLLAGARAQAAADAAALAAVAAGARGGNRQEDPTAAARRVSQAGGADLRSCRCPPAAREAEVSVSVPVRAVAATRFAARTITARSRARLVPAPRGPPPRGAATATAGTIHSR